MSAGWERLAGCEISVAGRGEPAGHPQSDARLGLAFRSLGICSLVSQLESVGQQACKHRLWNAPPSRWPDSHQDLKATIRNRDATATAPRSHQAPASAPHELLLSPNEVCSAIGQVENTSPVFIPFCPSPAFNSFSVSRQKEQ